MPIRAGIKKTDKVCKFVNINLFFSFVVFIKIIKFNSFYHIFALFGKKIQVSQPLKGETAPQSQLFSNVAKMTMSSGNLLVLEIYRKPAQLSRKFG